MENVLDNPRMIQLVSDDGRYTIVGKMVSEQDSYTQDNWMTYKTYTGSHWEVTMRCYGKRVNHINGMHFGQYACGLCQYGVRLTKNTILYLAKCAGNFTQALIGQDLAVIEKKWTKEYVEKRIAWMKENEL